MLLQTRLVFISLPVTHGCQNWKYSDEMLNIGFGVVPAAGWRGGCVKLTNIPKQSRQPSVYIHSRRKTQTSLEKLSILLEGEQPLLASLRWLLCCRSTFRAAAAAVADRCRRQVPPLPGGRLLPNVNSNFFKPG